MFFHSQAYLLFFAAVYALYWLTPGTPRGTAARTYLLLAASVLFYAVWSELLALLVLGTTCADYFLAHRIARARTSPRRRRLWLGLSLGMNLGLLAYFKYANFFLDALRGSLHSLGVSADVPFLQVMVPFGISFYTFEAISYAVDVAAGRVEPERRLSHFLLFILFFPHLVAGPIVRAGDFLPQVGRVKRFSWPRLEAGLKLFALGLLKKSIADRMAVFCDPVFEDPTPYGSAAVAWAVLAFSLRIYCDFSGYSDMALGSAHLLGFKLTRNFDLPYLAANIGEFWRRWHVSLSNWLRDYVFIPLGGSRGSSLLTARNLLITMLLGGLWHGAQWSYLIWGGLHGLLLISHRAFAAWAAPRPSWQAALRSPAGVCLRVAVTFGGVSLLWVFFQPSLANAVQLLEKLVVPHAGQMVPWPTQSLWMLALLVLLAHLGAAALRTPRLLARRAVPVPLAGVNLAGLWLLALLLAPPQGAIFLYFTF